METDEPMAAAPVALPKEKKGGKGAVIGMIFFMLVAIGLGVWVVILLLNPTKCNNSSSNNSGNDQSATKCLPSEENTEKKEEEKKESAVSSFDYEESKMDYASAKALVSQEASLVPLKMDYTKDGKYMYMIADVYEGVGGYAIVLYRENKKGAAWTKLQGGHNFSACSDYSDVAKNFMSDYKYIDDDLGSRYVGCYVDPNTGDKTFPE